MKPRQKGLLYLVLVIVVLLVLITLNPSFIQFKEFLGDNTNIVGLNTGNVVAYTNSTNNSLIKVQKIHSGLFYSVYERQITRFGEPIETESETYLGICRNFFKIEGWRQLKSSRYSDSLDTTRIFYKN